MLERRGESRFCSTPSFSLLSVTDKLTCTASRYTMAMRVGCAVVLRMRTTSCIC